MATIKVKYKGQWVDADEAHALRMQEQAPAPEPAPVDVATLPDPASLDPDVPLDQLIFEHPEVRPYIYWVNRTKTAKVRGGLKPAQRAIAEQIIARYGGASVNLPLMQLDDIVVKQGPMPDELWPRSVGYECLQVDDPLSIVSDEEATRIVCSQVAEKVKGQPIHEMYVQWHKDAEHGTFFNVRVSFDTKEQRKQFESQLRNYIPAVKEEQAT